MIHLAEGEKILMVLHRHWIVIIGKFAAGVVFAFLPVLLIPAVSSIGIFNTPEVESVIILFFLVIYLMIISLMLFIFWVDYYLDMWVITTDRIIDIEQYGLFKREISEIRLDKVQDITVEIPDIIATFMKYGNIIIQTAGERHFTIKQIPRLYEAKNLILDQSKKNSSQA